MTELMERAKIYEILGEAYFGEQPHELETLNSLRKLLPTRGTFVDIGASLGQYTKAAAGVMKSGKIIAVEADPIRFDELQRNCETWRREHPAIEFRVVHAAVSDVSGQIEFQTTNSNVSGGLARHALTHLPVQVRENVSWDTIQVPAITIDELLADETVDLIKMDIEGAEWRALQGAPHVLQTDGILLLIELHPFGGPDGGATAAAVVEQTTAARMHNLRFFDKHLFGRRLWYRFPRLYLAAKFGPQRRRLAAAIRRRLSVLGRKPAPASIKAGKNGGSD